MSDRPDGTADDPLPTTPEQEPASATQPAAAAAPPGWAGRYRLEGEVARGGMGAVYRALDPELGRTLAVKVLLPCHAGQPALEARFLEEARVSAQLQHPGVPPVHEVGRLEDGRPFLAMRLVKGQTLDRLLADRRSPAEDLPRLVALFGQVCQAVAYAHSRGVIHRDLKPANVMVGAFGEVQLMDWGLAKVLGRAPAEAGPGGGASTLFTTRAGAEWQTQAGSVLGTPAYMAPEQAKGQLDRVDERSDVFGLGAILCQVLTGRPPYAGEGAHRQARQADLADAFARLDSCGADGELIGLARRCLAAEPGDRPGHAGEVAQAVAAYQAGVQERLRQAEVERAAAQARAAAERRARRLTLGLAAAALLLLAGGAAVAWAWQRHEQEARERRQQAEAAVALALTDARRLREQAVREPLGDAGRFREARAAAQRASELARTGDASEELRRQAEELAGELAREEKAAEADRRLLDRLLEGGGARESPKFKTDDKGLAVELPEPSADEELAAAFRDWGLDVDAVPVAEAAARLKQRPPAVVTEVVAALDEWADERRRQRRPRKDWQRLGALADALDGPNSRRRQLRAILAGGRPPQEWALGRLAAGLQRVRLRRVAEQVDPAREPVLGLLTLARALWVAGDQALAERLLREAVRARPGEVALYQALGEVLESAAAPRWGEAVECYTAVRALRPGLGARLAHALVKGGRVREGLALYDRLVKERSGNPWLALMRGYDLYELKRFQEAEAALRAALRLRPDYPEAHTGLGGALTEQGRLKQAEAAFRQALRLKPDYPGAHDGLGVALERQGRYRESEAEHRAALRLDPRSASALDNLGVVLGRQGRWKEAEAAHRAATRLSPDLSRAHYNLGTTLGEQGKLKEAEAAFRQALRLKPDYPEAHDSLGVALERQGRYREAEAEHRAALRLRPRFANALDNLGVVLGRQGRWKEAEAAHRAATRLSPDFSRAHFNLGQALLQQGRFADALEELRRCHALGSKVPAWRAPAALWVRRCQGLLELDRKLPAVLRGDAEPAGPAERLGLAEVCSYKGLRAAAARLADEAFTEDPRLAADLDAQHRYSAACSAALAAAGKGEDARLLPDKVVLMLRLRARRWLRAHLDAYAKLLQRGSPAVKRVTRQRLAYWHRDPDLASVRDKDALAKLPADERAAWHKLWAEVDALLGRLAEAK